MQQTTMDNGVRKFEQVSISGKLPERCVTLYVGKGKSRCLTCESFLRGIGIQKTTDWIMEYEEFVCNDRQHPSQGPESSRPSVQDSVPTERVCEGMEQCGATADC